MKYNGIKYSFTKEEVEAVATILKFARETNDQELYRLSMVVATAFNRSAIEMMDKAKQDMDNVLNEIRK